MNDEEIKKDWIVSKDGNFGVRTIRTKDNKTTISFLSVKNILLSKELKFKKRLDKLEEENKILKKEINKIKSKFNIDFDDNEGF